MSEIEAARREDVEAARIAYRTDAIERHHIAALLNAFDAVNRQVEAFPQNPRLLRRLANAETMANHLKVESCKWADRCRLEQDANVQLTVERDAAKAEVSRLLNNQTGVNKYIESETIDRLNNEVTILTNAIVDIAGVANKAKRS